MRKIEIYQSLVPFEFSSIDFVEKKTKFYISLSSLAYTLINFLIWKALFKTRIPESHFLIFSHGQLDFSNILPMALLYYKYL